MPLLALDFESGLLHNLVVDLLALQFTVLQVAHKISLGFVFLVIEIFLELSLDVHLTSTVAKVLCYIERLFLLELRFFTTNGFVISYLELTLE